MNPDNPNQNIPPSTPPSSNQPNSLPPIHPAVEHEYPVDYLNQISQKQTTTGGPSKIVMIIAAVVGLLAIVIFLATMFSDKGPDVVDQTTALRARFNSLAEVAKENQTHLKDSRMYVGNTNLNTFLLSASSQIIEPAKKIGIADMAKSKPTKNVETAEEKLILNLNSKFSDAALSGSIDRTYASEMNYQLDKLQIMIDDLYKKTKNKEMRDYLDTTSKNLTVTQRTFAEFAD